MMNMRTRSLAVAVLLGLGVPFCAASEEQTTPPPPGPPPQVSFEIPLERTLGNGVRVVVVQRPALPLLSVHLVIAGGAENDPKGLAGLANLTVSLLSKGTEKRSAPQIAAEIEQLGASLDTEAGWDYSAAKLTVISSRSAAALDVLADVVRNPAFKQEEIDRLRHQVIDGLRVDLEDPANLAKYAMTKLIFDAAPYGHAATGLPETLTAAGRDQIVQLYKTLYRPSRAILVFSGNILAEDAFEAAQKCFGDWPEPADAHAVSAQGPDMPPAPRTVVIDVPEAGQAAVMIGKVGIERTSKEFVRGMVSNAVLGTGYSSRLNEEIRIKRGLSYGAACALETRRNPGPFVATAQTKNESAVLVASLMKQQVAAVSDELVGEKELETRKAALTGEFGKQIETNSGYAGEAGVLALYGLPFDFLNSYTKEVQAVTPEEVRDFATTHLQVGQMSVMMVGNAKAFQRALKPEFKDAETIKSPDLDLNATSLRRGK